MTPPRRGGATLLELLVSVAVMAVLTGLLLAAVQKVRHAAAAVRCKNNVRQVGLAATMHHDAVGWLPPAVQSGRGEPLPYLSWLARLLPHLDDSPAWDRATADYARTANPFQRGDPHTNLGRVVPLFGCPLDARTATAWRVTPNGVTHAVALSSYLGNAGTDGGTRDGVVYRRSRTTFAHVSDGLSNTILAGERPPSPDLLFGWWYAGTGLGESGLLDFTVTARHRTGRPEYAQYRHCPPGPYRFEPRRLDDPCGVFHLWSPHPGGTTVGFCDGSVRFLRYGADAVLPALMTRAGGEAATD